MPSSENSDRLTERHIVRFYSRMQHLFGHKWTSSYGEPMGPNGLTSSAQQWFFDLRDFTPDQVSQGLRKIEQEAPEWPPTPMDFKKRCIGVPSIEEVMDRRNDYGPICGAIRAKMDWFNLDSMTTKQSTMEAMRQYRQAITNMIGSGQLHRLALMAASKPLSISDESED